MDQRACYRVSTPVARHHFELYLELPNGAIVPARMDDVSARGLTARTGRTLDPPLAPGASVTLRILCPTRGVAIRIPATVRDAHRQSERGRYGLAFRQSDRLESALPADLFSVFNRRRFPRLPADRSRPARLALAARSHRQRRLVGALRDLSVSGASIAVPASEDPGFRTGDRVTVTGQLPGGDSLHLAGRVRRVQHTSDARIYGIEFDPSDARYPAQRLSLDRFISTLSPVEPGTVPRRAAERRIAQRARPDAVDEIRVEISGPGKRRAHAVLRDLSPTGAGVVVRALDDPEFGMDETMELRLRLLDRDLGLVARVRRGLLIDDQVCYGLEFDWQLSENFPLDQEAIREFVEVRLSQPEETPLLTLTP